MSFKPRNIFQGKQKFLIFILLFGIAGGLYVLLSFAATSAKFIEPETNTISGNASLISDATASNNQYVLFEACPAGQTGTPPNCVTPPPPTSNCDLNATTSNFAAQLSAASAGQRVCLATGNYGVWNGINKSITLLPQSGAKPTIELNIGLGDGNFTLDSLTISGGIIYGNQSNYGSADRPQNITIKNSTFTGTIDISYIANANILLDHNTHNNIDVNSSCTSAPARVWVSGEGIAPSGVTLSNSILSGGNSDGVQVGLPMTIINNEFYNIQEKSSNDCAHTDAIQFYGGTNTIIRGNYIHDSADGIVAYDGTAGNTIENNVIDLVNGRFGIELYSDKNSVVRHNTLVYGTGCAYTACGGIYLDHKSSDPAGTGTIIENNIATSINIDNGSSASVNRNNMLRTGASGANFIGIPQYQGGTSPTSYIGFTLLPGSPGIGAASDGGNVGR